MSEKLSERMCFFSTKAEQLHVSVATASILARAAFLKEMDRLSELAGIELLKGASAKVDALAARIWRGQGENFFTHYNEMAFCKYRKSKENDLNHFRLGVIVAAATDKQCIRIIRKGL